MNIIQSDLVSSKWEAISNVVQTADPKPVLIWVNTYDETGAEEAQLIKMLEACKLDPGQYSIIQLQKGQQTAWHRLREMTDPKIVFLIGILPSQLGISSLFRLNGPNHFNDRVWLPTLSLKELEERPDIKKQLWIEGMKPILSDKSYGDF